jgi:glycine/D-amino acid oxidase-like deaminating enzyme
MQALGGRRGVDIIQNCPVTAIRRGPDGAVQGVDTAKGFIKAPRRSRSRLPGTPRC